jgi:ribonuclease-3
MVKKNGMKRFISSILQKRENTNQGESKKLDSLYRTISYRFRDEALIKQALTHRSLISNDAPDRASNERLEFLGDAVLGMVVSEELYRRFPDWSEGELTKAKSYVVSREVLAKKAEEIGLGKYLILSSGEEKSGGRRRKSIISDAFEALLGAIYFDAGLEEVKRIICHYLLRDMNEILTHRFHYNYKSWLLEHVQAEGESFPEYRVLRETGPDHKKEFTIEVVVNGRVLGRGKGLSKKRAEQKAALEAIQYLGLHEDKRESRCMEGGDG